MTPAVPPARPTPLPSRAAFAARLLHNAAVALIIGLVALDVGTVGFHRLGGQPWVAR